MNLNICHFTIFLLRFFPSSHPRQKLLLRETLVFFLYFHLPINKQWGVSLLGIPAELRKQALKQPTLRATVVQKGLKREFEGVSNFIQHPVNILVRNRDSFGHDFPPGPTAVFDRWDIRPVLKNEWRWKRWFKNVNILRVISYRHQ